MISKIISQLISSSTSILFPDHCYICKKDTLKTSLCTSCLSQMKKTADVISPYIKSIYSFKDQNVKRCIHAIKYFHRKDILISFAKVLAEEIKQEPKYKTFILVPIPMPRYRKYVRGYNHTEILANLISKELEIPNNNSILTYNSSTSKKRQVLMHSRNERLQNRKNTFTVNHQPEKMNIILIDDVTTTGATLHEARKVLLARGAASVIAFTIAH